MRLVLLAGLVGCYSPTVHPGAPCGPGGACPASLVCAADQTCQPATSTDAGHDSPAAIDAAIDGPPGIDGCATCIAPANDLPGGATDVTAGGDFTADLTYAHDDAQRPANGNLCGSAGGLDVFYKVVLSADEVYYFDTFGSDFDTVIRVIRGDCVGGTAPNGTSCRNDACGVPQTQYATTLTAGTNCIVIDGLDGTQTGHSLKLHVEPGGRTGTRVATTGGTFTGNTTMDANVSQASCAMHVANDHGYYFTACPGQSLAATATTCNMATATAAWDTAVYATGPGGELACTDDDGTNCSLDGGLSTVAFTAAGAHLFWIVVDAGSDNVAGAYELDVTLM